LRNRDDWQGANSEFSNLSSGRPDQIDVPTEGPSSFLDPNEADARTHYAISDVAGKKPEIHHLSTDKNNISKAFEGPYTPKFQAIFQRAGMNLQDVLNKVPVFDHKGPHPEYNMRVFKRLDKMTKKLKGDEYKSALQTELRNIAKESKTPGTKLNKLITRRKKDIQ
jgi:hypothetical protein